MTRTSTQFPFLLIVVSLMATLTTAAPASAGPGRTAYPTIARAIGTMGHEVEADWYRGTGAPGVHNDQLTSFCHNVHVGYEWGVLTNPHGYEIRKDGTYGDHVYMMYDPKNQWLRPANVNRFGILVAPTRDDSCAPD